VGSLARINTRGYRLCVHASWREAILSACGRNTHGKTRTNDDTRRVVTRLLTDAEWQHWSDRESARHCGVSHVFMHKLRKSLSEDGSEEKQDRTYKNLWGACAYDAHRAIGRSRDEPPTVAFFCVRIRPTLRGNPSHHEAGIWHRGQRPDPENCSPGPGVSGSRPVSRPPPGLP
jgi:hypothetical protein